MLIFGSIRVRISLDNFGDMSAIGRVTRYTSKAFNYCRGTVLEKPASGFVAGKSSTEGATNGAALTEAEFAAAVRDALRHFHRPDRLRDNPLLHCRLVAAASSGESAPATTQALRNVIRAQCASLGETEKTECLKRVLELTYLAPMQGQQQVADALHLSWSTYRRRLSSAVQSLAARLWEAELALAPRPDPAPDDAPPVSRGGRGKGLAGLVAACAIAGVIAWFLLPSNPVRDSAAQTASARNAVAVLPFENLSADPKNRYFAAGIQDEILTYLAKIGDLRVIARTATAQYKSHPDDLRVIADQLHVGNVLEGSVQKLGKQVNINVQLIDAHTLSHIWARSYTRKLTDTFGVESEVAAKVAAALNATLTTLQAERLAAPPTHNARAYGLFLQARYYADRANKSASKPDFDKAMRDYRLALREDPGFALAWARLSIAASWEASSNTDHANLAKLKKTAGEAANQALQLAPKSAAAHLADGWYQLYFLRDRKAAATAFRVALSLQPNNAQALFTIGVIKEETGESAESVRYLREAVSLDPRNTDYLVELAGVEDQRHNYAAAEKSALLAAQIDPDSLAAVVTLSDVHMWAGDFMRAAAVMDDASKKLQGNPLWKLRRTDLRLLARDFSGAGKELVGVKAGGLVPGYVLEVYRGNAAWYAGDRDRARSHYRKAAKTIESHLKKRPHSVFLNSNLGWVYARLGKADQALAVARELVRHHRHASNVFITMVAVCNAAFIEAQLGKTDAVLAKLNQLYAMPHGDIISAAVMARDPQWDPIRDDPRFEAVVKQYAAQETPLLVAHK
jgi:TolB-like protein/Flp pilus assembly protein TadD